MSFSFFSNRKVDESLSLLIDIGSASVGIALAKIEKGQHPHILASVREDISFQEILSSHRFMRVMEHSLSSALKKIETSTKKFGRPSHIFCTLSSPWFILKNRSISISRVNEFGITPDEISKLIDSDIELLKEDLKGTLPGADVRIIEKKVVQIKLNGYEVKNPYGQRSSRLELNFIVGLSSKKVIESIEKRLSNFFHIKSIHFGVFPVAAFGVIRDIFPEEKNFIFLDITGEATDITLVNNNLLIETVSFPRGSNFFVRELSLGLRTVHEEGATLFAMFLRNELDEKRRPLIEEVITRSESEWHKRFRKALGEILKNRASVRSVFFTSDTDVARVFSRLISKGDDEDPSSRPLVAHHLDQAIVSNFVTFETGITRDPFVVIEALFALKLIEQHT